jgi:hypothetical protein
LFDENLVEESPVLVIVPDENNLVALNVPGVSPETEESSGGKSAVADEETVDESVPLIEVDEETVVVPIANHVIDETSSIVILDVKQLSSLLRYSPGLVNDDITAVSPIADDVTSAPSMSVSTADVLRNEPEIRLKPCEKEFDNEMGTILGASGNCFDAKDIGRLRFTSTANNAIRKIQGLIKKCDRNYFNGEFFEMSVKNLRSFLLLPDEESIASENAVHKITMIFFVLANLTTYFDKKNAEILFGLIENYVDCKCTYMFDAAVQFGLTLAMVRLSPVHTLKMDELLRKWFDDEEREIDRLLRKQYSNVVIKGLLPQRRSARLAAFSVGNSAIRSKSRGFN